MSSELRRLISEIFVRNNLRTDQVAISELEQLLTAKPIRFSGIEEESFNEVLERYSGFMHAGVKEQLRRAHDLEIEQVISSTRKETLREVEDYLMHSDDCILEKQTQGRPTATGGYEVMYAGKWYQSTPVDETPDCDCGLHDILQHIEKGDRDD